MFRGGMRHNVAIGGLTNSLSNGEQTTCRICLPIPHSVHTQQTQNICILSIQRLPYIFDVGPTFIVELLYKGFVFAGQQLTHMMYPEEQIQSWPKAGHRPPLRTYKEMAQNYPPPLSPTPCRAQQLKRCVSNI